MTLSVAQTVCRIDYRAINKLGRMWGLLLHRNKADVVIVDVHFQRAMMSGQPVPAPGNNTRYNLVTMPFRAPFRTRVAAKTKLVAEFVRETRTG